MVRTLRLVFALYLCCVCLALTPRLHAQPAAGAAAPNLSLPASSGAEVKLHETVVFRIRTDLPKLTAAARARAASRALEHALESDAGEVVRIDNHADARVIFASDIPIVELYEADAGAAQSASLDVYAANVAAQIRSVLHAERMRSDTAATVFSISLVVFFGFIALMSSRKLGQLATRARDEITEHPERIGTIRLNSVQLIGAGPLRAVLLLAVTFGRWVLQIGVLYVWLALSLSRFEATRPYTDRLNRALIDPLSGLAQRTLGFVPILVLSFLLVAAVFVSVRFVQLFFTGVSLGQERATWVPRDLVGPASVLIRIAIVLLALLFAGPLVSGDPEGVLARCGMGALLAVSLAATPILCSIVCGVVLIFTRRVQMGVQIEWGPYTGRVIRVGLLDVLLRGADGSELRVPHLRSLTTPIRVLHAEPRLGVTVCVNPQLDPNTVIELFGAALRLPGGLNDVQVELFHIDADGAHYRASVPGRDERSHSELLLLLVRAMQRENLPFGRGARA